MNEKLNNALEVICDEFSQVIDNAAYMRSLDTRKQHFFLTNRLAYIPDLVRIYAQTGDDDLYDMIINEGIMFEKGDWDGLERRYKAKIGDLQRGLKRLELEAELSKTKEKASYYELLAILSKFQGHRIDIRQTTLKELAYIHKQYKEYIKEQKKNVRKNKR